MEQNSNIIGPLVTSPIVVESEKKPLAPNKGGRPKKYPPGYKGPRGKRVQLDQDRVEQELFQKLIVIQDEGIGQLRKSFFDCMNPQQVSSALLNVRTLMESIKGGKTAQKSKEIASALKVGNENWSRQKAVQIASGAKSAADIAAILRKDETKPTVDVPQSA